MVGSLLAYFKYVVALQDPILNYVLQLTVSVLDFLLLQWTWSLGSISWLIGLCWLTHCKGHNRFLINVYHKERCENIKGLIRTLNRRTDNAMTERQRTKTQTMIYNHYTEKIILNNTNPTKTGDEYRCPGKVSYSCPINGTRIMTSGIFKCLHTIHDASLLCLL